MSLEADGTAGNEKPIRIGNGLFIAILGSYGGLLGLLFAIGWLIGFAIFPPRPAVPPRVARVAQPAAAPEPAPAPAPPEPAPPPPDPLDSRLSELRNRLSGLLVPRVGLGKGANHRFQILPETKPTDAAVVADDRRWALAVAVEAVPGDNGPNDNGVLSERVSDDGMSFWVPTVDAAGASWRVRMAGEATTVEARAEANRLREADVPAIPVRVPDLAGIPLRRWTAYLAEAVSRFPVTLRLASYRTETGAQRGRAVLGRRMDGIYMVRFDLEGRGRWWSLYTGHFVRADEARRFASTVSEVEPLVREMPYGVLVGLADPEAKLDALSNRIHSVLGVRPYPMPGPAGLVRWMVGAYLKPDSATALAEQLRENGIPAWGVER